MSLLTKIAKRNIGDVRLGEYSEEAIALLSAEAADALYEQQQDLQELKENHQELSNGLVAASGLSELVEKTTQTYAEKGLDDNAAELYKVSVECFLAASGLDLPIEAVVPSFEDGKPEENKEAVKDKGGNVIKRIYNWVVAAFSKLIEMIRSYFEKSKRTKENLTKLCEELGKKVDAIKGGIKNDKPIGFGARSKYLTDKQGHVLSPAVLMHSMIATYQKFCKEWNRIWDPVLEIGDQWKLDKGGYEGWLRRIEANMGEINRLTGGKTEVYYFASNWYVAVTGGSKDHPILKAKIVIKPEAVNTTATAPVLDKIGMQGSIAAIGDSLKGLEKIRKIIDDAVDSADETRIELIKILATGGFAATDKNSSDGNAYAASLNLMCKTVIAACSLMNRGWSETYAVQLEMISACLKYVEVSASRHHLEADKDDEKSKKNEPRQGAAYKYNPADDDGKGQTIDAEK